MPHTLHSCMVMEAPNPALGLGLYKLGYKQYEGKWDKPMDNKQHDRLKKRPIHTLQEMKGIWIDSMKGYMEVGGNSKDGPSFGWEELGLDTTCIVVAQFGIGVEILEIGSLNGLCFKFFQPNKSVVVVHYKTMVVQRGATAWWITWLKSFNYDCNIYLCDLLIT